METSTQGKFLPVWKPHLWAWNQMTGQGHRTLLIRRARSQEYELYIEQNNGILVPTSVSINLFPQFSEISPLTSIFHISCEFLFWALVTWNHAREVIQVNVLHHGQNQQCHVGTIVLRVQSQILLPLFYRLGNWIQLA